MFKADNMISKDIQNSYLASLERHKTAFESMDAYQAQALRCGKMLRCTSGWRQNNLDGQRR